MPDVLPLKLTDLGGGAGKIEEFGASDKLPYSNINLGGPLGDFRNLILNPNFSVNQLNLTSSVTLAAGAYGHDGWKAGASGCTYTFVTTNNVTTIIISSGSLQQVIPRSNLMDDTYTLSWQGTAQGKIGAGAYSSSAITVAIVANDHLTIEFGVGTLSLVQLERGPYASPCAIRPYSVELTLAMWYFRVIGRGLLGVAATNAVLIVPVSLDPIPLRINPSFTGIPGSGSSGLVRTNGVVSNFTGFDVPTLDARGGFFKLTGAFTSGAQYVVMNDFAQLSARL